jgi:hypothetical protein
MVVTRQGLDSQASSLGYKYPPKVLRNLFEFHFLPQIKIQQHKEQSHEKIKQDNHHATEPSSKSTSRTKTANQICITSVIIMLLRTFEADIHQPHLIFYAKMMFAIKKIKTGLRVRVLRSRPSYWL